MNNESIPSAEPATSTAVSIISRAAVYLRDLKADDVHDPSVGLRRDMQLVALVDDVEAFLKQSYQQPAEPAKESQPKEELVKFMDWWLLNYMNVKGVTPNSTAIVVERYLSESK